ncbi:class I SAM-dependent methyltransferase [Nocardia mangyaensis]|uniref:class I SAM-dependent methyltransferase n=1 Tax=Nocardia mangyaensis TaxID=2213200 RepID=UPI002675E758|nr:class I SAM-dependent methyltransferase [Nocardia mangyaensis]MDO3646326.1 class I SAM-dependent methyltransferase [Nocardia mangyaensis]
MRQPSGAEIAAIYDKNAAAYDQQIGWFERVVLGDARRWVTALATGKVVEFAVGTGLNLPHYGAEVRQVIGIDLSSRMLGIAGERVRSLGLAHVQLRQGDVQDIDLPDATVDTVVSTFSFCTVPDPGRAAEEAFRLLAPGGRFVLAEHGPATSAPWRTLLRLAQPLALRFSADHLLRDPIPYLTAAGFVIEQSHRGGRGGITFRVLARKPGQDRDRSDHQ